MDCVVVAAGAVSAGEALRRAVVDRVKATDSVVADALVRWLKNGGVQLFMGRADEGLVQAFSDARLDHCCDN